MSTGKIKLRDVAALVFLFSLSGLVGEAFLAVKEITSSLERELQAETDLARQARISQLTRDIDRLQPLTACGLFREVQSSLLTFLSPRLTGDAVPSSGMSSQTI